MASTPPNQKKTEDGCFLKGVNNNVHNVSF